MVMRYFGGGIGHLKNTPPQQVPFDPIDPNSEETTVGNDNDNGPSSCSGTNENLGTTVRLGQSSRNIVMNSGELEVSEDDEDDEEDTSDDGDDSEEGGGQNDEDEDEDEDGDDYGYASA
jgi:hypothetical protein